MKIKDEVLRDVLQRKITIIKNELPRTALRSIEEWANIHYKMKHGVIVEMLNNYRPIETLSYDELFKLMNSIKYGLDKWRDDIDLSDLNEDTYFEGIEKSLYAEPVKYESYDNDFICEEFLEINPNKYSIKLTLEQHANLRNIGRLRYNSETQRDLIEVVSNGIKYDKIDINPKSVDDIQGLLKTGNFECDDLTININTDINTDVKMLPRIEGRKLIIPKEAILDVLDGWHRSQAFYLTYLTNPEVEFTFGVKIVIWNTAKATQFILLQDKKNHLKQTQTKRINKEDEANFIIDQLKADSNFYIKDSLTKTTQYDLNIIINDIFAPSKTKRKESLNITKSIKDKINELVYAKDYFDKEFTKEEWYIYLYIIKTNQDNFMKIVNSMNISDVIENVGYKNKPLAKGRKYLDKIISEVE